jgi:hypothetical protein
VSAVRSRSAVRSESAVRNLLAVFCLLGAVEVTAGAQEAARTVDGRVLRPGASELEPVRNLWVTLHRVAPDGAGPLDSIRTDARGAYRFRYTPTGDERAIYFAAASYGGVAYFTPPLAAPAVAGETAEIVVFDTTSAYVPITVRGRHLVVSAADAREDRSVVEVYELSNDSTITLVSPSAASPPTWMGVLPAGARDPRVTEGDIPQEAVTFANGRVRVVSPIPPGVKQLVYTYTLPASAFPLSMPVGFPTDVFEVLIEDPAGSARGAQLEEVESVTVDGRRFRRFLAQDVAANAVSIVDIPRVTGGWDARYVIGLTLLLGGTMLFALARVFKRV